MVHRIIVHKIMVHRIMVHRMQEQDAQGPSPLVRSDKYFVSFSTCNPTACSHWFTQSQKEADIYYLFIIGWHTIYFSSYWLNLKDLSLLHMSRLRWKLVQVEN